LRRFKGAKDDWAIVRKVEDTWAIWEAKEDRIVSAKLEMIEQFEKAKEDWAVSDVMTLPKQDRENFL